MKKGIAASKGYAIGNVFLKIDNEVKITEKKIDDIDGEKARNYFESTPPADKHSCSMCGKMCAVRTTNMILEGKKVEFCAE